MTGHDATSRPGHASIFRQRLTALAPAPGGRRWLFVPYDQLTSAVGPLAREPARELGIVVVEAPAKASQRPYHQQKLALVLANLRHFALEQAARGVAVRHVVAERGYGEALAPVAREVGGLRVMVPAERELRADLAPLVEDGSLQVIPHEGWCTTRDDFAAIGPPPWRMDAFYRHVRRRTGILVERGRPVGGRWSLDAENRRPWRGSPPAPEPPRFTPDEVTAEVVSLVQERFAHHPGRLDPGALPATADDAERLWAWARRSCLPSFGPFEDAMTTASTGLFHTRIAPLLNLHRLLPRRVIDDVVESGAPLASVEGFVRQVLGWREYVRHVHHATDGFREVPGAAQPPASDGPGDGGWATWRGTPWRRTPIGTAAGASPSFLGARDDVPPALWGAPSGLACLDHVVADVWREAWGHHITRLMIVANLMTLLGVSPRALTDWFWAAYVDAYDWVVEPNVLAMGTYGVGPLATTKPYVSGAAYIARMSDFCRTCRFDPRRDCPVTPLYWSFLARHEAVLGDNPRMLVPLTALRRRAPARRAADAAIATRVREVLGAGRALTSADLALAPDGPEQVRR